MRDYEYMIESERRESRFRIALMLLGFLFSFVAGLGLGYGLVTK